MKNGKESNSGNGKVIDMTERITAPDYRERLRGLKVRFDLENAKVAVSTSLLSVVILVTLANNNLMTSISPAKGDVAMSEEMQGGRSIASVPGGGYSTASIAENPELVRELGKRDLSAQASVGHLPSSLERLAFGYLEGKYAVRLQDGVIREIEFSPESNLADAKRVESFIAFIDTQRELLPEFSHSVKVGEGKEGLDSVETFQLVNSVSMPVAKVQFRVDGQGHLLGMRVSTLQLAAK